MNCKLYCTLPEDAIYIRKTVFMKEQGFCEEFDDLDEVSKHVVLYEEEVPISTCRFYWDNARQCYIVGRIAVVKEYRGKSYGAAVLKEAERQIQKAGGKSVCLAAQVQAAGFYAKQGYTEAGHVFFEEHCPHIWMYKNLK